MAAHAESRQKSLTSLKQHLSNLDGWEFSHEKDGVKLYSKSVSESSIPLTRGDTLLPGHKYTPQQVASVATLPGCRSIWDEKFGGSEIKEMYSRVESLFWAKIKTPWPVSPRDICGTSVRELSDDLCYVCMSTVKDDKLPELSGHVRANLMLSGWKFEKVDAGVAITYVNHIDLAGSIPSSFLKGLQLQVPLCAGKVVSYVQDYGFAPTTTQCTANFKTEEFDHAKREYVAQIDGEGEVSWIISKTMYPNGVKTVAGSAAVDTKDQEDGNQVLTVKVNGPLTVKITKA